MAKSTTKVDVWNRALGKIGESNLVQSESESEGSDATPEAEACALLYDDCLLQVLEMRPWPFAIRQATLAQPSGVSRTGWEYVYALPSDCVRPLALLADGERIGQQTVQSRHPFAVVEDDDENGQLLCTDLDNTADDFEVLEYVGLHEHVPSMPRLFVNAVVWLMAAELSDILKKDTKKADYCLRRFELAVAVAAAAAFEGQVEDVEQVTPSIAARD